MCGIHGLVVGPYSDVSLETLRQAMDLQFKLSDSRGKEASGWAIRNAEKMTVHRQPIRGSKLVRSPEHLKSFSEAMGSNGNGASKTLQAPLAMIGHSRLVTNGSQLIDRNNQPIARDGIVAVHNGIIVNDQALWEELPAYQPNGDVDTEVLACLIHRFKQETGSVVQAVQEAYRRIEGSASVAVLLEDSHQLILATNTGSLYLGRPRNGGGLVFASERYILDQLMKSRAAQRFVGDCDIVHVLPGQGYVVDLLECELQAFELSEAVQDRDVSSTARALAAKSFATLADTRPAPRVPELRRCTQCVLPETFPFLKFDDEGVCSFCRNHKPMMNHRPDDLAQQVAPYRNTDGDPDCIVAFSGGRDSSYCIHYLKRELGLHPIAFTYDWGMVNDLARRNQARICGKLGIEHIIISADIRRKRANIRRNVETWLKRPRLGMVPLFMAGDKQFFYYANKLRKQSRTKLMIFAVNPLEKTGFKSGFCGVSEAQGAMYFNFTIAKKLRISLYYLGQYLANPGYFNRSLSDTAWAFFSSFIIPHDYLMFYDYIRWEEKQIDDMLKQEYDWEIAEDTGTTWRIGDGTAAFYNYIYYTVAGFTENDTFRSNQIREGMMTRSDALARIESENQPRWDSMKWYSEAIGFDLDRAIGIINKMPKLYEGLDVSARRS